MLPHLRRLPERVDRILTLTGRGELRVRTVTDEDGRRILRTLVNRALLGAIGAAVLAVSAVLLVAAGRRPGGRRGHRPVRDLRLRRAARRRRARAPRRRRRRPGRHDMTRDSRLPPRDRTAVDRARRTRRPSRRASATTGTPATSSGSSLWRRRSRSCCCSSTSPPAPATACAPTSATPRRSSCRSRVRQLAPRRRPGRRRARPGGVVAWCSSPAVAGGASAPSSRPPPARRRRRAARSGSRRAGPARRGVVLDDALADLDPVPVAGLPGRRRRGGRGRQALAVAPLAAGRRPARSWSLGVTMAVAGSAGVPSCCSARRRRWAAGAAILVAVGAPNRRPTPAAIVGRARRRRDRRRARSRLERARRWPGPAVPAPRPPTGRRSSRSTARTAATPTCSTAPTAHWCCASADGRLAVAVARARRRARGAAAAARRAGRRRLPVARGVVAARRRVDGAGDGGRRWPPARRAARRTSIDAALLDAVWQQVDALHRAGLPTARCGPPTCSSPTTAGRSSSTSAPAAHRRPGPERRRSTGPSCSLRSPPLVGAERGRRLGGTGARSRRPGRGDAVPATARAVGGDPRGAPKSTLRAPAHGESPRRRGTSPCRSSGSSGSGRAPLVMIATLDRRLLHPAAAARQRRRQRRRAGVGRTGAGSPAPS